MFRSSTGCRISCGLITDGGQETTFTDIQGVEDFYGDMDFKVAGTKKGITAIQVDIKVDGLTPNIIKQAFEKCRVARYGILDEIMLKAIPQPREDVSDWAPKMTTMHINPDKIREVIGKGGSVIQNIVAESGAKVDIEDDGTVTIAAVKATDADKAKKMIEAIVRSRSRARSTTARLSADELRRIRKPAAGQGRHGSHLQDG